jgi:hypothetical protein
MNGRFFAVFAAVALVSRANAKGNLFGELCSHQVNLTCQPLSYPVSSG